MGPEQCPHLDSSGWFHGLCIGMGHISPGGFGTGGDKQATKCGHLYEEEVQSGKGGVSAGFVEG